MRSNNSMLSHRRLGWVPVTCGSFTPTAGAVPHLSSRNGSARGQGHTTDRLSRHTSTRIIVGWDRQSAFARLILKQLGVASPIHRRLKLPHRLVRRIIFIQNVEEKIGAYLVIVLLLQRLIDR